MNWCFGCFFHSGLATPPPGCHGPQLHMSSTMWYIMQSIQSKYSLSERLIRTIAAIRSFPHDNVEDLIRKVRFLLLSCEHCILPSVSRPDFVKLLVPPCLRELMWTGCMGHWSLCTVHAWLLMRTAWSCCCTMVQRYAVCVVFSPLHLQHSIRAHRWWLGTRQCFFKLISPYIYFSGECFRWL